MAETVLMKLAIAPFEYLTAEWWDQSSKCVVVRGSLRRHKADFSLRLDLDKRVFLDHVEDGALDKVVQRNAEQITKMVWQRRAEGRVSATPPKAAG